ncbi:putative MFS multidrug resistance transporter [Taphrina deformans PYCC 5710]|uniref:MFS multidrug resistance transporter n=1 Tax=Taphrina deformans (strain PYCC 5710 / ATCC 11124 / CBS 356.35 / IMI 108563 / JCM 9778 / NBRC 8474) TaxID=1097556 RepID=R4XB75_TAPDE|nr:putative MFS multidrug resistance transporter [Taphrina deformans PYCC 5710]|eukprot:CCG81587.1 putative MFS multidrug resistance transporter [Taphrina deformans PYCC 5710]
MEGPGQGTDLEKNVGTGHGPDAVTRIITFPSSHDTTPSTTTTAVPRPRRSGLLSSLTVVGEIEDPRAYSGRTKSFLVFVVACAATSGPMSCGIMFPALAGIEADLGCSATVANLSVSVFLLGMGVSPLWLAYVSEHFGRRPVYLVTFALYVLFTVLTGFSGSVAGLLCFRALAALSAGSAQALGAGTIADIYVVRERGHAIGWFYLGPLVAPLVAPVLGGLLTAAGSWRNTQWFLAALGALVLVLLVFCLPETLHDLKRLEILDDGARGGRREPTGGEVLLHTLADPLRTFLFLRHPAVTCSVVFASLNFGGLYVMNISVEYAFSRAPYRFSTVVIGCLYLGNSTGYILGSIVGGRWCDAVLRRAQVESGKAESVPPERRIGVNAWTGAALAPLGIILYGWTIDGGLFWFAPLVGTFLFGLGTMFIYSAVTTYLIDVLPGRSSSAMALNNFVRNVLACAGSVLAVPAIDALGEGVLFSIIGGLFILSTLLVLAIVLKGDEWREKAQRTGVAV